MSRYLSVDFKSSQLFEYSKEAKEGFEAQEGRSGFRKYFNEGITGELLNVGVRDSKIGQQINMALKDIEGEINVIQVGLYDQKGNVDNNFAESLISYLPSLEKGRMYRFFPYNLTAETLEESDKKAGKELQKKYYDKRGISLKEGGEVSITKLGYNKKGEKDSTKIPSLEWKKDPTGKNKPSAVSLEAKNEFLLSKLMEAVDGHLKYEGNNTTTNSTPSRANTQTQFEPVESSNDDYDHDDLPF